MKEFYNILGVAGPSGSGKTTLSERLMAGLIERGYQPAFAKHSSHQHYFDKKGKDTARLFDAGAGHTLIGSMNASMLHAKRGFGLDLLPLEPAFDLVVLEGFRDWPGPKIRCLHPDPAKNQENPSSLILAEQSPGSSHSTGSPQATDSLPRFDWNAPTEEILDLVLPLFQAHYAAERPLKAALMAGGESRRMGEDKAGIDYGRGPQLKALRAVLQEALPGASVHLSRRPDQSIPGQSILDPSTQAEALPVIEDRFLQVGPLGGILSLFAEDPNAAWLVLAVDLACLDADLLKRLIQARNPLKLATVLQTDRLEPLAAIYEPAIQPYLQEALFSGDHGLTGHLRDLPIQRVELDEADWPRLLNANRPEEVERARQYWSKKVVKP